MSKADLTEVKLALQSALVTADREALKELSDAMNEFILTDQVTAARMFQMNDEATAFWDAIQVGIAEALSA